MRSFGFAASIPISARRTSRHNSTEKVKKPLNSSSVRVLIHRAREMLAEQVLDLVLDSLDNASLDECEQELIDLNLLEYCRPALQRRRGRPVDVVRVIS